MKLISLVLLLLITLILAGCTTIDTPIGRVTSVLGAKTLAGLVIDVTTTNGTAVKISIESYESDNSEAAAAIGKGFEAITATAKAAQ